MVKSHGHFVKAEQLNRARGDVPPRKPRRCLNGAGVFLWAASMTLFYVYADEHFGWAETASDQSFSSAQPSRSWPAGKIGSQQNLRYTYALGENTQVIASLDSHGRQRVKLSGLGALEAPCVNLSKRRLGRVARHGGLLGSDLCDCKCAPEIVSAKTKRRNNCRRMCSV
jgi:hypothetical protein